MCPGWTSGSSPPTTPGSSSTTSTPQSKDKPRRSTAPAGIVLTSTDPIAWTHAWHAAIRHPCRPSPGCRVQSAHPLRKPSSTLQLAIPTFGSYVTKLNGNTVKVTYLADCPYGGAVMSKLIAITDLAKSAGAEDLAATGESALAVALRRASGESGSDSRSQHHSYNSHSSNPW